MLDVEPWYWRVVNYIQGTSTGLMPPRDLDLAEQHLVLTVHTDRAEMTRRHAQAQAEGFRDADDKQQRRDVQSSLADAWALARRKRGGD